MTAPTEIGRARTAATGRDAGNGVVVAVFASGPPEPWVVTLSSLRRTLSDCEVVVGTPDDSIPASFKRLGVAWRAAATPARLIDEIFRATGCHVLVCGAPVVLPPDPLAPALAVADTDLRCASVSFLSNAAAFLSFPHRNTPSIHQIDDLDEVSITRRLRTARHIEPAVVPYATGPVVLLTSQGMSVVGPFPDHGPHALALAIADYSCRAHTRGMVDLVDPRTFILRPRDVVPEFTDETWLSPAHEAWLRARYPAVGMTLAPAEGPDDALGGMLSAARAAVTGVRVVIDGTCLGPKEMGTQVTLLSLIGALADRDDVESLGLIVNGPVPIYATEQVVKPKVHVIDVHEDLASIGPVDVMHRPFHAAPDTDVGSWRAFAARTVMTVHDLIAYEVSVYHRAPSDWLEYRAAMREAARQVDGIVVVSAEARRQLRLERMPVDDERVFVVSNGVDHISGVEVEQCPDELLARGFSAAAPFMLVLGTDYSHKNRDKAIDVLGELHVRGYDLELVLVGAHVPYGSSRVAEAVAIETSALASGDLPVHVIPDVTSPERNWLLRHASVVLYPTSAEGFGLIPHEAAAFGTPTVFVPFGPLAERFPDLPVAPKDWSTTELAGATESLLRDPAVARAQVETLARDVAGYDWSVTAAEMVDVYLALLAKPARHQKSR